MKLMNACGNPSFSITSSRCALPLLVVALLLLCATASAQEQSSSSSSSAICDFAKTARCIQQECRERGAASVFVCAVVLSYFEEC